MRLHHTYRIGHRSLTTTPFVGLMVLASFLLQACQSEQIVRKPYTHTETDTYTRTVRDTMFYESVRNVPGRTEDSVAARSRSQHSIGETFTADSVHDRLYPNFLRAGGIEIAGLMGSNGTNGIGTGLFGLYGLFDKDITSDNAGLWAPSFSARTQTAAPHLTKGELVRILPVEYRLRWFDDAPDWTLGWSAFEMIAPNEMVGHDALISTGANLYVRRRIYLRDQIPHVFVTPLLGGSLFPSMYANLGAELTVGSLGGMNVRAYAGVASGFQWAHPTDGATFPYFGFGVSALDFINRVEETQHEWKDYVRTTMDVNIAEVSVVKPLSSFDSPFGSGGPPLGWDMHLASVEIPMPALDWFLWHDRISGWIGTSLLRWSVVGSGEQAISVLPLRAGYRLPLGSEALMLEPFVELSYYPSQVADVGLKLRNDLKNGMGWGLALGYRTGSAGNFSPAFLSSTWPVDGRSFSTAYLGFQLNVGDWMNDAEVVRDSRAHELPSTIQGTTKP